MRNINANELANSLKESQLGEGWWIGHNSNVSQWSKLFMYAIFFLLRGEFFPWNQAFYLESFVSRNLLSGNFVTLPYLQIIIKPA